MQPPICILRACESLRRQTGAINCYARAYSLPLRGGGCEKVCMGQRETYSSDGVCLRTSPRKLCFHWRKKQETFRALGLLHSGVFILVSNEWQQVFPDRRAFKIIQLKPDT